MAPPPRRLRLRSPPLGLPALLRRLPELLLPPPRIRGEPIRVRHRDHRLGDLVSRRPVDHAADSAVGAAPHTHDTDRVAAVYHGFSGGEFCGGEVGIVGVDAGGNVWGGVFDLLLSDLDDGG